MRHFFTTKVKIVLVVALLLTAGLAVASNLLGTTVGEVLVQGVLTPLRTGASWAVSWVRRCMKSPVPF